MIHILLLLCGSVVGDPDGSKIPNQSVMKKKKKKKMIPVSVFLHPFLNISSNILHPLTLDDVALIRQTPRNKKRRRQKREGVVERDVVSEEFHSLFLNFN